MTMRDRQVLEALRDEPELLAIADAVAATGAIHPRRRRMVPVLAAATAVAAVVAVLLVEPWGEGRGPSLAGRALAAIGDGPILHAVVRYRLPGERVELATGRTSPLLRTAEIWADEQKGLFSIVARADGRVITRRTDRIQLDFGYPFGLAALYRQGLEDGKLHKIGEGIVRGRDVIWVESPALNGFILQAALDRDTYDPLVMKYVRGDDVLMQMDILEMGTVAAGAVRFGKPSTDGGPSEGSSSVVPSGPPSASDIGAARRVLSHPVLWLGRTHAGLPLSSLGIDAVETSSAGPVRARIVHLEYGTRPLLPEVAIDEFNIRKEREYIRAAEEVVPPSGYVDLDGSATASTGSGSVPRWSGALRRDGLFVRIEAGSRADVWRVARALRPVESR